MSAPRARDDARPLILVVDDNEQNRALVQTTLEEEGHLVRVASGGEEALLAFEEALQRDSSSLDPLYNMAAQLVAAELNYAAGAAKCPAITTAIASANALLTKYGFTGTGSYASAMTAADKQLANSLAQKLDDYNNNRPNACQ